VRLVGWLYARCARAFLAVAARARFRRALSLTQLPGPYSLVEGKGSSVVTPLSILDLSPIASGSGVADALRNTVDLARHAERLGYRRYWLAEHHLNPGVAGAVPELLINSVAAPGSPPVREASLHGSRSAAALIAPEARHDTGRARSGPTEGRPA
jgi:hypothetical protein